MKLKLTPPDLSLPEEEEYEGILRYNEKVLNCDMVTGNSILNKLRELKPILYKEYAVKEIGLFGSFSDGSYTEESDIDILIELEKPIGWKFFSLEMYLEKVFNRKIDLVTKNALKKQLRDTILQKVKYV